MIDPDDPTLAGTADMPERIAAGVPRERPAGARVAGRGHPRHPRLAGAVVPTDGAHDRAGQPAVDAEVIHLVGGGALNELLARLCASACERPVLVGPAEATVVGNALVQAIADGAVAGVEEGRSLVQAALPPSRVEPERIVDWDAVATRL